ncbi:glycosyltransferase family 2 protein [candidate division KSB1 bacterium]|nr:glycosyltransferase family 2 protein [candidate division KSB1 bacterium]
MVNSLSILIAIPAYNEEKSISDVIGRVRSSLGEYDLLVVNDGSVDNTAKVLKQENVTTATHLCNLGYGRAIQTIVKFALKNGYDGLITLDADGQHQPEQIRELIRSFENSDVDMIIGSRHLGKNAYKNIPFGRKIGMLLFSRIVGLLCGKRIYDTSSGLKAIRKTVFKPLIECNFVDFHAEAIVYLMRLGYKLDEFPITVAERTAGESMYSFLNHFKYPLKTGLLIVLSIMDAEIKKRGVQK